MHLYDFFLHSIKFKLLFKPLYKISSNSIPKIVKNKFMFKKFKKIVRKLIIEVQKWKIVQKSFRKLLIDRNLTGELGDSLAIDCQIQFGNVSKPVVSTLPGVSETRVEMFRTIDVQAYVNHSLIVGSLVSP